MAKVGFLGLKRFFSTAPTDFLRLAPEGTDVAGTFIPTAGFGATMAALSLDAIASAVSTMKEAAQDFAQAGADVVAQFGVPFSLVHGAGARGVQASVSRAAGVPVALMGVAMLDALSELGARSVAVAGGYYAAEDWAAMARSALTAHGFDVVYQEETWSTRRIGFNKESSGRLKSRTAWPGTTIRAQPAPTCERRPAAPRMQPTP